MRLLDRLLRRPAVPPGVSALLAADEYVATVAEVADGGCVVVTSHGLWLPGPRRVGWHQVSKATWADGVLSVIEAAGNPLDDADPQDGAELLADLPPLRLALSEPGRVPQEVQRRVTESVRYREHRELPGGGAWFVRRKVAGQDGLRWQVRADPGTDEQALRRALAELAGASDLDL